MFSKDTHNQYRFTDVNAKKEGGRSTSYSVT